MGPEIVVPLVVLVVATIGALAWWKLAAKAAPYKDEVAKGRKTGAKGPEPTVIRGFGESKDDRSD
ncbi:MAG: hypothetical protein IIC49_03160 [Planctomycetes bacterium]|nr:hypothetical protein [Planctomycetota bacterium]